MHGRFLGHKDEPFRRAKESPKVVGTLLQEPQTHKNLFLICMNQGHGSSSKCFLMVAVKTHDDLKSCLCAAIFSQIYKANLSTFFSHRFNLNQSTAAIFQVPQALNRSKGQALDQPNEKAIPSPQAGSSLQLFFPFCRVLLTTWSYPRNAPGSNTHSEDRRSLAESTENL